MTTKEARERARTNYMNKMNVVTIPKNMYEVLKSGKYGSTIVDSCNKIVELLGAK